MPGNWMKTVLAHHKSVLAKQAIEKFLSSNTKYPDNLKNKILEAAWELRNQVPYVEKAKPEVISRKRLKAVPAKKKK